MKRYLFLAILWLIINSFALAQNNGIIEGRVYNAKNNEPVPFATITIFGTTKGTVSDIEGNFTFTELKPGYTELRISSVGFEPYNTEDIHVTNARKAFIEVPLKEAQISLEGVDVVLSPFRRNSESPVSLRRIDLVEIEKNPGGNRDISKVIQSYPGVASTPAYRNDIIVRGGGASENRFYLDGVEIPNLNHFATQGASGGPIGIINIDFVREVDFFSGAFPSNRGNTLSSILELKQIDGNKEKLKVKAAVGASDLALTLDGPIGEKSTFIASARRSYLQLLFSALELPFLPTYNDFQFKTRTRFNEKNELVIIGLGAIDNSSLNLNADETEEQRYILGYLPINEQYTYTLGAVFKHFRERGFDTWVLSRNHLNNSFYKYLDNSEIDSLKILDYDSDETEIKFRYEHTTRYENGLKLNVGAGIERAAYGNSTFKKTFTDGGASEINYNTEFSMFKWGVFGQLSRNFLNERLLLSLGMRMDASDYSKETNNLLNQFSPRFSASYLLTPGFYLNFNTGRYYQLPAYTSLGFKNSAGELVNKENGLKYITADHLVAGIEWQPGTKSRLTLEGFLKLYDDYPFSISDSISISSKGADFGTFGDEELSSLASGRAYGFEVLYRNKDLMGANIIISYTYVISEAENFRNVEDPDNAWLPTAWDNRHLLNVLAFRELGKDWRAGIKWRFVGGAPYTPFDADQSSYVLSWNSRGTGVADFSRYNAERLGAFHQLDLRIDKEIFLKKSSLNFYLDIQNLYNFKANMQKVLVIDESVPQPLNPGATEAEQRYKLKELSMESGTILPTIGIIIEF